jgi:hypothetical protein
MKCQRCGLRGPVAYVNNQATLERLWNKYNREMAKVYQAGPPVKKGDVFLEHMTAGILPKYSKVEVLKTKRFGRNGWRIIYKDPRGKERHLPWGTFKKKFITLEQGVFKSNDEDKSAHKKD